MSIRFNINKLDINIKKWIIDNLVYKSNKFNKLRNYNKYNKNQDTNKIECYNINNDYMYIPYNTAFNLFKHNYNKDLMFPKFNFYNNIKLYNYQISIYNEAMANLKEYGTTTLYIYTGAGKTLITVKLSADLGYITIILVSSTDVATQWVNNYKNVTNMEPWLVDEKLPEKTPNVIICMDGRLHHIPIELLNKCGTLVVDEAHTFCTELRIKTILKIQPKYVIMCTATLKRSDGLDKALKAIAGNHHIYRKSDKPFMVYKYNTGINVPIKYTYYKELDFNALLNDLSLHIERNKMILKIVKDNPSFKILIMTRRVSHVEILYTVLKNSGESVDYMSGNKKSYKDSRILVGSIQKIGTGFDEKSLCPDFNGRRIDMLILANTIKNDALLEQVVGRAFRSDFPHIIHLVDDIDIIKYAHWKVAENWYISRNGTIQEVFSDYYKNNKKINTEIDQIIPDDVHKYI